MVSVRDVTPLLFEKCLRVTDLKVECSNLSGRKQQQLPTVLLCSIAAPQVALKCADIGHLAATQAVHRRWASLLEEEFYLQVGGRQQPLLSLQPPMCNNLLCLLPNPANPGMRGCKRKQP